MAERWRVAVLVCAAIAISYLDRQSLPVAIQAIQREIPLSNTQFGDLASVFLLAYAVIAGMIEYAFVYDHTRGSQLVVLTVMLALFMLNVPVLIAFTVARFQPAPR